MQHTVWETFTFLRSCANRYSYTLAPSQSSIKSYASARPSTEISSIELLEQCSLLHYLIILFFWQICDVPGILAFFASTDLRADLLAVWTNVEEFVKARTQLKKELGEIGNCSTLSWWVEEPECPQDLCLLLVIGLQLTSSLDIDFLTFKKWKVLILARI